MESDVSLGPDLPDSSEKIGYDDILNKVKGKDDALYDLLKKNPSLDEIKKAREKFEKKDKMSEADRKGLNIKININS